MKLPDYMDSNGSNIIVNVKVIYFLLGKYSWFSDVKCLSVLGGILTYERVGAVSLITVCGLNIYQRAGMTHNLFGFNYTSK